MGGLGARRRRTCTYQLLFHPGYLSFCDVSATISCTQVYQSPYVYLRGVPVALFGALWYVVVLLVLAGRVGLAEPARERAGYVFALSTVGLGFVMFLAFASFFLLKTVCLMCLVTYGAVAGLFVLSGTRTPFPMTHDSPRSAGCAAALASPPR